MSEPTSKKNTPSFDTLALIGTGSIGVPIFFVIVRARALALSLLRHLAFAVVSAGAAVGAARRVAASVAEARAAHRGAALQGGALAPDLVCVPQGGMEQQHGCFEILSATQPPGHDCVARKIFHYNADPDDVRANKDTAAQNFAGIEAVPDTTPSSSVHTSFGV